jgi:LemA protein
MTTQQIALVAGAALFAFWTLGAYNRLMALRNGIGDAFAQVDDALRGRATALDLLATELSERAGEVAAKLEQVSSAQSQLQAAAGALRGRPARAERAAALSAAEAMLQTELVPLVAWLSQAAEGDSALALHAAALNDASQRLAFACQWFNDAVQRHNDAARQFPTRLVAGLFGFTAAGRL